VVDQGLSAEWRALIGGSTELVIADLALDLAGEAGVAAAEAGRDGTGIEEA
jgi:hypothetical protein